MEVPTSLNSLAKKLAIDEVKSFFTDPVHLDSLSEFREEYEKKLVSVETQLDTGVQAQLDEMQNTVVLLNLAKTEMEMIRKNFSTIHRTCVECREAIGDFDRILKARNARINVNNILRQLDIYEEVPRRVAMLHTSLDESEKNLKPVFDDWITLHSWKDRILNETKNSMGEARAKEQNRNELYAQWEESLMVDYSESSLSHSKILIVLGDHFAQVVQLEERIWDIIEKRISEFYILGQLEDRTLLTDAVQVAEKLDKHDSKERQAMIDRGANPKAAAVAWPQYAGRNRILANIRSATNTRLDKMLPPKLYEEGSKGERVSHVRDWVQAATTLFSDLEVVFEEISACFPASYDVYGLFRSVVERRIMIVVHPLWTKQGQAFAVDKLQIVSFLDSYVNVVESINNKLALAEGTITEVDHSIVESQVSAHERIKEFAQCASDMMTEYINESLPRMKKYVEKIVQGSEVPETSSDGSLFTTMPEDLFHVITQEIEVVVAHGIRGKLLSLFIRKAIIDVIRYYQEKHTSSLTKSSLDTLSVEWVCAFINDFERMYDLCDNALIKDTLSHFKDDTEDVRNEVLDSFERVSIGFIKCADVAASKVVDIIFNELINNNVIATLFTPEWESNSSQSAATLKATFEDYIDDNEASLRVWIQKEIYLGKTVAAMLDRLVQEYVGKLFKQTRPCERRAVFIQRMRNDRAIFLDCFKRYDKVLIFGKIRSEAEIVAKFEVISLCANILESNTPKTYMRALGKEFGPFTLVAVSRLLFYRGDITPIEMEKHKSYVLSSDFMVLQGSGAFDLSGLPPLVEQQQQQHETSEGLAKMKKAHRKSSRSKSFKRKTSKPDTGIDSSAPVNQLTLSDFLSK